MRQQLFTKLALGGNWQNDLVSLRFDFGDAHDQHASRWEIGSDVPIWRKRSQGDGIRVRRSCNKVPGFGSKHSNVASLRRDVPIRRDSRVHILRYDVAPVLRGASRRIGEKAFVVGKYAEVGRKLAFWSESPGVLAVPRLQ